MTDIINLNSIRSDNCDCNKPKPKENSCGCHNHKPQPCYLAVDLSDLYFKVKNLFGELKSEWQRAEARSNLGIVDILKLELTDTSLESGGTNVWTMTTLKGGVTSVYKFYVKNGLRGETGPLGKSAYDVYCETTTDYPVKTLAQWLNSLKGEVGDTGPAGMSAYELAQKQRAAALLPTLSLEEWLLSLKGEKGDKGDSGDGEGDKIVSVTLVNPPTTIPEDTYVWRITLKSGQTFDLWTPKEGGGGESPSTPSGMPTIMYQKIHYDYTPTETELSDKLELLQLSVNRNNLGKTVDELETLGWTTYAGVVRENDFVFMASTIITDDYINLWQVVRLTPLPGKDGTSGEGTRGDFKSTAFTRTNTDISNITPRGGDYDHPYPQSEYGIIWEDGIPSGDRTLWATTRTFKDNDSNTLWSLPKKMTDTLTYDVEFSPIETNPGTPDSHPENWYDPSKSNIDWTTMIWRAEREYRNGEWGNWIIIKIKGEQGPQGPQGPEGPGGNGQGTLGLTGPVIRMRGEWQTNADPCYVNESLLLLESDRIRFIDVVFYLNNYYMVKNTTSGNCVTSNPTNTSDWELASAFNFAYIQTLITQYLSNYSLDTEEVRIHNRSTNPASDIIVAGMTSGKKAVENETNNAGDVRIWAGSNVNVLNPANGLYQLDVLNAPFRVTQNGNLYAENADIKGVILADILRLGEGSFSTCESHDATNAVGKVLESNGNLILPELLNNKVQMFYLLTDTATSDINVKRGSSSDKITYFDSKTLTKVTGNTDVNVSPNRLYQFFGIDHEWRVCEVTLAPLNVIATTLDGGIVDPSYYSVDTCSLIIEDEIEITEPQSGTGILNTKGELKLLVTNLFTSDITVHIADLPLKISWKDGINTDASYTMDIETNGLIIPAGTQSDLVILKYDRSEATFSNDVFTVRIQDPETPGLKPQLSNLNVTLNDSISGSVNLNAFLIKDINWSDNINNAKYDFTSALISATYSRGPSNITLNASSPSSQGDTGGDASDSVWVQTNLFNVDFSPNVAHESVSVGGVGYEYLTLIEFLLGEEYITSIPETSLSTFEVSNTSSSLNIALTFPDERSIYVYIKYNRNLGTTSSDCFFYGGRLDFVFNGGVDNCTCNTFIIPPATTWKAKRLSMTSDKLLYTFNENYLFSMEFKNNNSTFVNARVKKVDAIYFSYTFFDELRTPKAVNNFEHADQLISSYHFSIPEVEGITTRNIPLDVLSQLLTLNRPNN